MTAPLRDGYHWWAITAGQTKRGPFGPLWRTSVSAMRYANCACSTRSRRRCMCRRRSISAELLLEARVLPVLDHGASVFSSSHCSFTFAHSATAAWKVSYSCAMRWRTSSICDWPAAGIFASFSCVRLNCMASRAR